MLTRVIIYQIETSDGEIYEAQTRSNPGLLNLDFHIDPLYDIEYNSIDNLNSDFFPVMSPLDTLPPLIPAESPECDPPQAIMETVGPFSSPLYDTINDLMHEEL